MLRVELARGTFKMDLADASLLVGHTWHISDAGYVVWRGRTDGATRTLRLHRLVNRTPEGLFTDHLNHDRLDNRRSNLRTVNHSENMRNLTNQGKGYYRYSQNDNWVVDVNNKHVASVETEDEAQRIVALVRAGGTYHKPLRTQCKHGHSLADAYNYGDGPRCRTCQTNRSRAYFQRKMRGRRPI